MSNSPHGNYTLLNHSHFPSQYIHRPGQIAEIQQEFQELPKRKAFTRDQFAAVPEHGDITQANQELEQWIQCRGQLCVPNIMADILSAHVPEALNLGLLLCVCPNGPGGPQSFLSSGRNLSEGLLDFFKTGAHPFLQE